MKIVKLDGSKLFQVPGGYIKPKGWTFQNADGSYVGFKGDKGPYIPVGGRKALQSILDAGGFTSFDGMVLWAEKIITGA
ncbi:3-isopropylmalate dehydratase [Paenibacillus cymbidii]|uniref:3-isopropylmalate dehydratase n=1 Tax=Paenibacillus cymbidii TaxID=1639034 RepID=UPI001080A296|nr:3-isopropylmalate dehydratase [Paenibacillus cymbidii]